MMHFISLLHVKSRRRQNCIIDGGGAVVVEEKVCWDFAVVEGVRFVVVVMVVVVGG